MEEERSRNLRFKQVLVDDPGDCHRLPESPVDAVHRDHDGSHTSGPEPVAMSTLPSAIYLLFVPRR